MCLSIYMKSVVLKPTRSMKKHNTVAKNSCFCHGQRCFKYPLPHPESDISKITQPMNMTDTDYSNSRLSHEIAFKVSTVHMPQRVMTCRLDHFIVTTDERI